MPGTTHLRSLQALELAIREGSLKGAAEILGITPAAVGQRIRALEDYLGTDLLVRGRSGLQPTVDLQRAIPDLKAAFEALERVSNTLDFQRVSEIHVVADRDWAELWLKPRLNAFRADFPNILFCINGEGDVPLRLGTPDVRVECGRDSPGESLYTDLLLPVCSDDNLRRIADWDSEMEMEGLPLLHAEAQRDFPDCPGWPDWFGRFGLRRTGMDRGVHYRNLRLALEAARQDVGFAIAGLSLVQHDLQNQTLFLPYGAEKHLKAPYPYRLSIRPVGGHRPQLDRFIEWLSTEAQETANALARIGAPDQAA